MFKAELTRITEVTDVIDEMNQNVETGRNLGAGARRHKVTVEDLTL